MTLATLMMFVALAQADAPAPAAQPLTILQNEPLRPKDLGIQKWTAKAEIGGDKVLSILCFTRRNGLLRSEEVVVHSEKPRVHEESIVVVDSSNLLFFGEGEKHFIRVQGVGTTNTWEVSRLGSGSTASGFGPIKGSNFRLLGSVSRSDENKKEELLLLYFARMASMKDYPKLAADIAKSGSNFGEWHQQLREIPEPVQHYLKTE